jgi:hypothetical protein
MSTEKSDNIQKELPVTDQAIQLLGGLPGIDSEIIQELASVEEKNTAARSKTEKKDEEKKVEKTEDKKVEKKDDEEGVEKKTSKKPDDEGAPDDDEEEQEEDGADEEEEKEVVIPDNKFGFKGKQKEKKVKELKIESFDELPSVIKSKYGQQLKDAKDLPKFFESVDKWRTAAQNADKISKDLEKVQKEKDDAIAVFENMPTDLLEAAKTYYSGGDYKKVFDGKSTLDFSKEKHSTKTLVNHYFPGEFTDADFEADETPRELKIAEKASIDKYKTEKASREQRAKSEVERASQKNKAFLSSVKSSVDSLKKEFPDMTADVIQDISSTLSGNALMSKFYNVDGTLKPNAAKMLALAEHGEEFISQLMEVAQRQGETSANEEFVDRARKKPKNAPSKGNAEQPRKEVTETIKKLLPDSNKRVF